MPPRKNAASKEKENPAAQNSVATKPTDMRAAAKAVVLTEKNTGLESQVEFLTTKIQKISLEKQQLEAKYEEEAKVVAAKLQEKLALEEEREQLRRENEKLAAKVKMLEKKHFVPSMELQVRDNPVNKRDDPRRPKPPATPYILWTMDNREKVLASTPGMPPVEVTKALGAMWSKLTPAEKDPYHERAKGPWEEYQKNKAVFDQIVAEEAKEQKTLKAYQDQREQDIAMQLLKEYEEHMKTSTKSKGKNLDPEKPKRAKSAYQAFLQARQEKLSKTGAKVDIIELNKEASAVWGTLSAKKKAPWEKEAAMDKERYEAEMTVYLEKKRQEDMVINEEKRERLRLEKEKAAQFAAEEERKRVKMGRTLMLANDRQKQNRALEAVLKANKKDPNKPKRPLSGYQLFSANGGVRKEVTANLGTTTFGAISVALAERWNALTDEDKAVWNNLAAPAIAEYKVKIAAYRAQCPDDDLSSMAGSLASVTTFNSMRAF